jgi:hypothetical protein
VGFLNVKSAKVETVLEIRVYNMLAACHLTSDNNLTLLYSAKAELPSPLPAAQEGFLGVLGQNGSQEQACRSLGPLWTVSSADLKGFAGGARKNPEAAWSEPDKSWTNSREIVDAGCPGDGRT